MESVKKGNSRLRKYPQLLAKCSKSAKAYAVCVTRDLNIQQKACAEEFKEFRECMRKAALSINKKL